jgi:hypothetical protein
LRFGAKFTATLRKGIDVLEGFRNCGALVRSAGRGWRSRRRGEATSKEFCDGQYVGPVPPLPDPLDPFVTVADNDLATQLSAEATGDLRLIVTFQTEDREIVVIVVRRILVKMMNLDRFAALAAEATGIVGSEENVRYGGCWNLGSRLCHHAFCNLDSMTSAR